MWIDIILGQGLFRKLNLKTRMLVTCGTFHKLTNMHKPIHLILLIMFLSGSIGHLTAQSDTTIHIKAIAGMQYDLVRIRVQPGSKVKLVLSNVDDMSHNLVVTKPGSRIKVVEEGMALAERGPEMNFIPDIPEVLWSIPVLAPGEVDTVIFTVPQEETVLPYVCTFPGHGYIMYGALYVMNDELPPLEKDMNIPEYRRKPNSAKGEVMEHTAMKSHPYDLDPPYYYRIFMPDASPASIAVRLTDEISFCWDAGPCQLLYAWQGGFIDNSVAWKGHKNTESRILGTTFYREPVNNPLRFGGKNHNSENIDFQGYRLKDRNPEFHYRMDDIDVYEYFQVSEDGQKLIRNFRLPDVSETVWLKVPEYMKTTEGEISGGYLVLTPDEAKQFSIEIPINEL